MEFLWKDHQKPIFRGSVEIPFDKSVIYVLLICFSSPALTKALYYTNKLKVTSGFQEKVPVYHLLLPQQTCILHIEQEDWAILLSTCRFPSKISQVGLGSGVGPVWGFVCLNMLQVDLLFWGQPEGITALQQGQDNKELQGENELVKRIPKLKGWRKRKADCPPRAAKFSFAYTVKKPCSNFKFHHQLRYV